MKKRIIPRQYQKRAAYKAIKLSKKGKRVLIVSPGASGKTVIIALLARLYKNEGKRVLIISHRREIIVQSFVHLTRMDVNHDDIGFVMAGYGENPKASVQLASVDTIRNRDYPEADVIIVDEAHHIVAPTYMDLVDYYFDSEFHGLTSTPYRLDGQSLGDIFDEMVVASQPSFLIKKGWMARPTIYTTSDEYLPDLRDIRIQKGDYARAELDKKMTQVQLVGNIVDHWQRYARNKTTLVFATSVKHSKAIAQRFLDKGIKALHLDSKMSLSEREEVLRLIDKGKTKVLCNCMILSEGYDLPQCEAVVLARPTKSFTLAQQQANRAFRPYGGRVPIILDHAKHYAAFGLPYADREFSLHAGQEVVINNIAPVKVCPKCFEVVSIHAKECACGYKFSADTMKITVLKETDEKLEELTWERLRRLKKRWQTEAEKRGFHKDWVRKLEEAWIEENIRQYKKSA